MCNELTVTAALINDKVKFSGISRDNNEIIIDYVPPIGDGEGYTSLELFLISLATCSGTSVALMLRRMHKDVSGLKVTASGVRREAHPTYFEKILIHFDLESKDVQPVEMERAIKLSEESICPVWNMVKNNVEISCEYIILNA